MKAIILISLLSLSYFFIWPPLKSGSGPDQPLPEQGHTPSVKSADGRYLVDYLTIRTNRNKKVLVSAAAAENLEIKTAVGEIPDFILEFLEISESGTKFSIANPGEAWQSGSMNLGKLVKIYDKKKQDTVLVLTPTGNLPSRQLVYFGIGKNIALLSYYVGGFVMTQKNMILQFENNRVTDYWFHNGKGFASTRDGIIELIRNSETSGGDGC